MKIINIAIVFLILAFSSFTVQANIQANIATKVAIEQVKSGISDVLDDVKDTGDYVTAKALMAALEAIAAWEEANSNLLDKTFGELNKTNRDIFNNLNALIIKSDKAVSQNLTKVQDIVTDLNQLNENILFNSKKSFVLHQIPLVLPPQAKGDFTIRLTGVNLDESEPTIEYKGNTYPVRISGPTKLEFDIPVSAFEKSLDDIKLNRIKLTHRTRDGKTLLLIPKYKNVERYLTIATMPMNLGTYELKYSYQTENVEKRVITQDGGRFKGKNTTKTKVIQPPNGWKWDLTNQTDFSVVSTGSGEAGRCSGITWNGATPNGIVISARLDEIREANLGGVRFDDGYKHCGLRGPINKVTKTMKSETSKGDINWTVDSVVSMPSTTTSFILKVKTFDGKERAYTGSGSGGYIDVTQSINDLIISSVVPKDFI